MRKSAYWELTIKPKMHPIDRHTFTWFIINERLVYNSASLPSAYYCWLSTNTMWMKWQKKRLFVTLLGSSPSKSREMKQLSSCSLTRSMNCRFESSAQQVRFETDCVITLGRNCFTIYQQQLGVLFFAQWKMFQQDETKHNFLLFESLREYSSWIFHVHAALARGNEWRIWVECNLTRVRIWCSRVMRERGEEMRTSWKVLIFHFASDCCSFLT